MMQYTSESCHSSSQALAGSPGRPFVERHAGCGSPAARSRQKTVRSTLITGCTRHALRHPVVAAEDSRLQKCVGGPDKSLTGCRGRGRGHGRKEAGGWGIGGSAAHRLHFDSPMNMLAMNREPLQQQQPDRHHFMMVELSSAGQ